MQRIITRAYSYSRRSRVLPTNTVIKFVPQQEAWVVERMGKFNRVLEPGLAILIPILDQIKYVKSLKEVAVDIPAQSAITQDNVTLSIDGVLYYIVEDPFKASYGVEDSDYAVSQLAQTTMRAEIGRLTLDRTLQERAMLNTHIVEAMNQACSDWGIRCLRYEIKDIHPPDNVVASMHQQVSAERRKRAEILESEGHRQAAINVAEGKKQSTILESQAQKERQINQALGEAESINLRAVATATAIQKISEIIKSNGPAAQDAIRLSVAEKYVEAFAEIAKEGNTIVVPANAADAASMVSQVIDGSKDALVEFYAEWCGHCKNLAPIYEQLADAFANSKDSVVIAKVNADKHRSLGSKFGVKGFPTLKWFGKSKTQKEAEDYQGGRELTDLVQYVTSKSGAKTSIKEDVSAVVDLTLSNFDEIVMNSENKVLVEFMAPWCGHCKNLKPIYEKVAKAFEFEPKCIVAKVDATVEVDLGTRFGIQGYPTLKFFGKNKEAPFDYSGGRDEQSLVDYLNTYCLTHRKVDGSLNENAGLINPLNLLVKELLESKDEEIVLRAKAVAESLEEEKKAANYYVKVMEKFIKNSAYPTTESSRLQAIIEKGVVPGETADFFTVRLNILRQFATKLEKDEL